METPTRFHVTGIDKALVGEIQPRCAASGPLSRTWARASATLGAGPAQGRQGGARSAPASLLAGLPRRKRQRRDRDETEMITKKSRNEARKKRHRRIWNRVQGSPQRPRLCVFRSLKHIYAQVVDDTRGTPWPRPPPSSLVAPTCPRCPRWRRRLMGTRMSGPARPASRRSSSTARATSTTGACSAWQTPGRRIGVLAPMHVRMLPHPALAGAVGDRGRDKKCPSLTPTAWTPGSGW